MNRIIPQKNLSGADAAMPYVVGKTAEEAKAALKSAGFAYRTVGSGETVDGPRPCRRRYRT
ncbi:MAG: PASTA domain-containing protein [Oscillospiraceae bacterium]